MDRWPLVGRDDELARLRTAAEEAAARQGQLALVTGESGIGKTALIGALAADVEGAGTLPLWGVCWEDGSAPAFWPWVQLARGYAQQAGAGQLIATAGDDTEEVARLLPQLRTGLPSPASPAEGTSARFRFFDAVTTFLCRAAQDQPLLLVLDDLHWADPSSLDLLSFAVGQLHTARILVVVAFRDDELAEDPSPQRDLLSRGVHVPLRGLGVGGIVDLVAGLTGQVVDDARAGALRARTGGNPLFVRETSRLLAIEGPQIGLPIGVRGVLDRRLARLSPPCRSSLSVAALRPEVELELLCELTDRSMSELLEVAAEAVHAGVLAPPATSLGPYTFTHALMREALQAGLSAPRRLELHARTATALRRRLDGGAAVHLAEVAHHLVQAIGAEGVDPREAASFSTAAAEEAAGSLAYAEAAGLLRRALEVLEAAAVPEGELLGPLLALADALRRAGDGRGAGRAYSRLVGLARRHGDAGALAEAALGLQQLGVVSGAGPGESNALLSEALDALGDDDSQTRALVIASLVRTRYHLQVDSGQGLRQLGEKAVAIGRRTGDGRTLASCLMALHDAVWGPGSSAERAAIAEEVAGIAADTSDAELAADASLVWCTALLELGDPRADRELTRFEGIAEATRQPRYRYLAASRRAMQELRRARLAEADRLSADAEQMGVELGEPDAGNVRFCQLWELRSQQGRRADLVESARGYQATAWADGWPTAATVLMLLDAGDEAAARTTYRVFADFEPAALPSHYGWLITVTLVGEAALAMGDLDVAGRVYTALLPYAQVHVVIGGAVAYLGAVAHRLGALAVCLGRPGEARRHLEDALRLHECAGAPAWAARSRSELGWLLVESQDAHDRGRGTTLLEAAAVEADEMGIVLARNAPGLSGMSGGENRFERQGDVWTLAYAGRVARLKDTKGLRDIAALLAAPGQEIAALDLVTTGGRTHDSGVAVLGSDPVLDQRAIRLYTERLVVLEREMAATRDAARLQRARSESEAIERELARARGLGGRVRRLDDPAERARKAVSARIHHSLDRLVEHHPDLSDHLRRAVRTGVSCCYSPPEPTRWRL